MKYGHSEREYAEDNDISISQAYSELHCDCEGINYEINEQGEIEFYTIQDYIRWSKLQRKIKEKQEKIGGKTNG